MIKPGNYIRDILLQPIGSNVTAHGWVRAHRSQVDNHFIMLNDGSSPVDLQVVAGETMPGVEQATIGACVSVKGEIAVSMGKGQPIDLQAHKIIVHGVSDPKTYPLPNRKIKYEKLREHLHFRARRMSLSAVFRVRNRLAMAIHNFFQERGFIYVHTPLISVSDAEGAGSMFHVAAPNPAPFHPDDLSDPAGLAIKLLDAQDPLSQYLRGRLTPDVLQPLAQSADASPPPESLKKGLAGGLNQLLADPTLYDEQRFAKVSLTMQARSLIQQQPRGEGLIRLNRLLLEEAYPQEIERNGYPAYDNQDFFKRRTFLTVSGQLEAEIFAHAYANVYTFGPTFRAEHSDTPRHLAEFYMIEPEMAFCDLDDNQNLAEEFLKSLVEQVLADCQSDLKTLSETNKDPELLEKLNSLIASRFERITYTQAIALLEQEKKRKWEYKPEWGKDLQSEHERFLTENYFGKPVIVTDYPREIKAFYMRDNDDGKTVAAMDVLVPRVGEIIGGSQREERFDVLRNKIRELDAHRAPQAEDEISPSEREYWWYLQLRQFGGVKHSGFGMGFERMMMYLTGMQNIRDVIPFPRVWKKADF